MKESLKNMRRTSLAGVGGKLPAYLQFGKVRSCVLTNHDGYLFFKKIFVFFSIAKC